MTQRPLLGYAALTLTAPSLSRTAGRAMLLLLLGLAPMAAAQQPADADPPTGAQAEPAPEANSSGEPSGEESAAEMPPADQPAPEPPAEDAVTSKAPSGQAAAPDAPVTEPAAAPVPAASAEAVDDAALVALTEDAGPEQAEPADERSPGGLKGGLNAGRWLGHGPAKGVNLGLCLGGYYQVPVREPLSLQFELLMTDKGSDLRTATGDSTDEALLYLEVPVLARYDRPLFNGIGIYGLGGIAPAYLVDSKLGDEDQRSRFDVSLTAGFGGQIAVGVHDIAVELRVSQGLLNVIDDDTSPAARNSTASLYTAISL